MESSKSCYGNPSSYALSFGDQNCNRYLSSNLGSTMSGAGRYFAQSAMSCVQNAIRSEKYSYPYIRTLANISSRPSVNCGATCSNLEQVAFGSQESCYLQSGFCSSGLTCQDYTVALMTLGHENRMLEIFRQTATSGNNCAYALKTSLDACYDWQVPSKARPVVWAAYFGTAYNSVTQEEIDPCGTQPPVSSYTPDPTPDPTVYPLPDPTPDPTRTPSSTPGTGDYSRHTCDNVGQCYSYTDCGVGNANGDSCVCGTNVDGVAACFRGATPCLGQDYNVDQLLWLSGLCEIRCVSQHSKLERNLP